jgi:hypothetical protein
LLLDCFRSPINKGFGGHHYLALWLFRLFKLIDPIPWSPVGKRSFGVANLARAPFVLEGDMDLFLRAIE